MTLVSGYQACCQNIEEKRLDVKIKPNSNNIIRDILWFN
jgi:hypothetical protein